MRAAPLRGRAIVASAAICASSAITLRSALTSPWTSSPSTSSVLGSYALVTLGLGLWLEPALRNLHTLRRRDLRYVFRPWFFWLWLSIPIGNILLLRGSMNELWLASDPDNLDAETWRAGVPSTLLVVWWAALLSSDALGGYSLKIHDSTVSPLLGLAADGIGVIASILSIALMLRVNRRQQLAAARLDGRLPAHGVTLSDHDRPT
jgi:hypothetical protein